MLIKFLIKEKSMKFFTIKLLFAFFISNILLSTKNYSFHENMIISENFENLAHYVFNTDHTFNTANVKPGDVIYVLTEYMKHFIKLKKEISNPYILITHDSDLSSPGKYSLLLNDSKLIHWFAENPDIRHRKITPIPLGLHQLSHFNGQPYKKSYKEDYYSQLFKGRKLNAKRNINVLCNFHCATFPSEQNYILKILKNKSYVYFHRVSLFNYLNDLKNARFILSLRGGGLDCHRTYEALHMGCLPIIKTSLIDVLFEDLPVVIINDWSEISEELLEKKHQEILQKKYNFKKLYFKYWKDLILQKRKDFMHKA